MKSIQPFIWLENGAKEAAEFYVSVFSDDSKITNVATISDTPSGTVEIVSFSLRGMPFTIMSAGPFRTPNEAISFFVSCDSQEEIDHFWNALSAVPEAEQCGWLKDRYGISWQIVPTEMDSLMSGPDKEANARVTQAMLQMKKIDIATLRAASEGN